MILQSIRDGRVNGSTPMWCHVMTNMTNPSVRISDRGLASGAVTARTERVRFYYALQRTSTVPGCSFLLPLRLTLEDWLNAGRQLAAQSAEGRDCRA